MLTRACTIVKRVGGVSVAPRSSTKPSVAPRIAKKNYCAPPSTEPIDLSIHDTLNHAVEKHGRVKAMPAGLTNLDEPTERVIQLVDQIMNITFMEASQLTRLMGKRLGTAGMQPRMMMGAAVAAAPAPDAAAAAAAAPAADAKKPEAAKPARVDLKLVSFPDANKFKVLKEIRNLKPGMNLMESKSLIEGLPKVVQEGLLYKDAEEWKKALNEAGAEVEFA